jgi:nuclear transport factor 2 (NTF2) superfamily protein
MVALSQIIGQSQKSSLRMTFVILLHENWEFAANGLMMKRFASINDVPIGEQDRKFRWERA